MANLNKVMLIGRLTRDPEIRTFPSGGKVASIGFAVNNRKRNNQTGQWESVPVYIDVEAFNRETGRKLADVVEQYLRRGNQVFIEGHLRLDEWQDKTDGSKRTKLKVVMDNFEFLEPRQDDGGGTGGEGGSYRSSRPAAPTQAGAARRPAPPPQQAPQQPAHYDEPPPEMMEPPQGEGGEDIPF